MVPKDIEMGEITSEHANRQYRFFFIENSVTTERRIRVMCFTCEPNFV